jgi:hypothetical protein
MSSLLAVFSMVLVVWACTGRARPQASARTAAEPKSLFIAVSFD